VNDVVPMNIVEDVTQSASEAKRIALREGTKPSSLQILHRDIQAAFLSGRNQPRNSRMIQLPENRSLPGEPCGACGADFCVRNLDHDRPIGMNVRGFVDGRHSSSLNKLRDLKTIVEKLADLYVVAQNEATLRAAPLRSR